MTVETEEDKFKRLAKQWREEAWMSVPDICYSHPAYQKILTMGWAVIPFIIQDLESGDFWFKALKVITDENITDDAEKWVEWWERVSYQPTKIQGVHLDLTDSEWIRLIDGQSEDSALQSCCANISDLRDEIVQIVREGRKSPVMPFRVAEIKEKFKHVLDNHSLSKTARKLKEQLDRAP
jgi:hypothetical protein